MFLGNCQEKDNRARAKLHSSLFSPSWKHLVLGDERRRAVGVPQKQRIEVTLGHGSCCILHRIVAGLPAGISAAAEVTERQVRDLTTSMTEPFHVVVVALGAAVVADLPLQLHELGERTVADLAHLGRGEAEQIGRGGR